MTGLNIHLDSSFGCFFVGILFSIIFYGVTCAQILFYVWEYPDDKLHIKGLVALLWSLDTGTAIAGIHVMYNNLVINHGNALALAELGNDFLAEYALAAIAILLVQCHYMHSIWRLIENKWYQIPLTIATIVFSLISCACSLASVYLGNFDRVVPSIFAKTAIPAALQTVSASVADIMITVSLTLILRGERTGFKNTETLVRTLTTYVVNRGILTTIMQIGQFITYVSLPDTVLVWAVFHFPGSKIYVNSLIAVLNARHSLRNRKSTTTSGGISVSEIPLNSLGEENAQYSRYRSINPKGDRSGPQAVITLTTEVIRDDGEPVPAQEQGHSQVLSKTPPFS